MTVQEIEQKAHYLYYCKVNYYDGIRPLDYNKKNENGYKILVEIAKTYFNEGKTDSFAEYMMEGQYFIQLWTAHLILDFCKPNQRTKDICLSEIRKYSNSTLDPAVAEQEKEWLKNYEKNSCQQRA